MRVAVVRGLGHASEPPIQRHDAALMAWAVDAATRKLTYIAALPRERTGLACGCVCAACGGALQAVNAGMPAEHFLKPNTHRQSFRHHSGQQQPGCLLKAAQLVALRLLVESNEVDLPAPSACYSAKGVSGERYTHGSLGATARARIVSREWIDELAARVTLEGGRVVVFRLAGQSTYRDDGTADAVITIDVDDPDVATWTADQILQRAQLAGDWLCWERHWDDDALRADAMAKAVAEARNFLDSVPDGCILPEGLSPLQKSESILHWAIKDILAGAGSLRTPAIAEIVTKQMPDGSEQRRSVAIPEATLILSDVRVEFGLDRMVPDILCHAVDSEGRFELLDLMIEVAITHRVDELKRERVRQRGLGCIEFDIGLVGTGGRIRLETLRSHVLGDPKNKRWIYHPELVRRTDRVRAALDAISVQIGHNRNAAVEREARFSAVSIDKAVREYLRLLRGQWRQPTMVPKQGDFWTHDHVAQLLRARGLKDVDFSRLAQPNSVLRHVDVIRSDALEGRVTGDAYKAFRAVYDDHELRRFVTLVLLAMRTFGPALSESDAAAFKADRAAVKASLGRGEFTFARSSVFDAFFRLAFPELSIGLDAEVGTEAYARDFSRKRQEAEMAAEMARSVARAAAQEAERRRQSLLENQREISDEMLRASNWFEWAPINDGIPLDVEGALQLLRKRRATSSNLRDAEAEEAVVAGWQARAAGTSIEDWLSERSPKDGAQVRNWVSALERAWIILKKSPIGIRQ